MEMFKALQSFYLQWQSVGITVFVIICVSYLLKRLFGPSTVHTKLHHMESRFNSYIINKCKMMSQPFTIPGWATNRHVQTVLAPIIQRKQLSFQREVVTLKDGGILTLDWAMKELGNRKKSDPVLLILPGLAGDRNGVSSLCKLSVERGYWTVVFNKRGYGNAAILTPKLQSFADPTDLKEAVEHIRRQFPDSYISASGSSAGSALLAAYLGTYGESADISAAVLNCPGYDPEALFRDHVRQPYNYVLLRSLKALVSQHKSILSRVVDMEEAMKSSSLIEFEEKLFCRIYGYSSMKEYWAHNDPTSNLANIAPPALCINSLDDPICVKENIPWDEFYEHDKSILLTTDKGGHCGFLQYPHLDSWADNVTLEFIAAVLELKMNGGFEKLFA